MEKTKCAVCDIFNNSKILYPENLPVMGISSVDYALEKIMDEFTYSGSDRVKITANSGLFAISMTIGIENNLKTVQVPVTFKKRIGISKTESDKN